MEWKSLEFIFIGTLLVICHSTEVAASSPPLCPKLTLIDIEISQKETSLPHILENNCLSRVLQFSGRDATKALNIYMKENQGYTALLFYAEWCPFSRGAWQIFDFLSILFPGIHHIAIESSTLWPSQLSEYGVRSFPAIFVQSKTSKSQFQGPRSLKSLSQFYVNETGLSSISLRYPLLELPMKHAYGQRDWGRFSAVWLKDNYYLAFAVLFLLLRFYLYIRPTIASVLRKYWSINRPSSVGSKRIGNQANVGQRKRLTHKAAGKVKVAYPRKEKESGKGVLSVRSWHSSSLAAVALAECSSRGATTAEDEIKKSTCGVRQT
ncbi:hypothetical protein KP509_38G015300 [Ceratopteris richardii]|nr:hypothetical protein KP509_38G015300 [Ceratopteris richardii]